MKRVTWDSVKWERGLPGSISQALAIRFIEMQREGKSLYMLTLMFHYLPGLFKNREREIEGLKKRIEIMWDGIQNRVFNRADLAGSFGVVFFDLGESNSGNGGLHAHILLGINENLFKGKYQGTFLDYWNREASRWIARPTESGCRDPIVRSHLQVYDGSEACIQYCGKSIGGPIGLSLGDMLYLTPSKKRER